MFQRVAQFKNDLPDNECRYAIYDFDWDAGDEGKRNKILFVLWAPDSKAHIKSKMLYTSSKDAIKKKLVGIGAEIQANDDGDKSYEEVYKKVVDRK